jgi:hypothetical protein
MENLAQLQEQMAKLTAQVETMQAEITQLQKSNPLWGKKYVACGDSFTQGDFNDWEDENGLKKRESPVIWDFDWQMFKTYPWWIAKRNNMTVINDGLCGSIIPLSREYQEGVEGKGINDRNPFSLERYKNIPEDTDYCTIWFGINDSAKTYLGSIDDTDNKTFYGAWNVVLEWILENRPKMKLGIIVTGSGLPEWREATRQVARKWGVPYLDIMGDPQVPTTHCGKENHLGLCERAKELRGNQSAWWVSPNNGHPSMWAHEYCSYFIEAFLRRL